MIIALILTLFFIIFFFVRRHSGAAHLAMIAGLSVYQLFGADFASAIQNLMTNWDIKIIERVIYVLLIMVFPLILYFRSAKGGLHGLFHLVESGIFALLLTALMTGPISEIAQFDQLSVDLAKWIAGIKGQIVVVGIIAAYIDILMYKSEY